jgi:hypothetical protein
MLPGKSFFRYAKASTGYEYQWSYSDYWTDIGTPNGARFQQSDGTWRRNFTRGYVVVNPSTHAAQIVQQATAPTSTPTRTPTAVPPAATATPSPGGATLTFNPAADAYVSQSHVKRNYGFSSQLRVDGLPVVNSFLRFNVQGAGTGVSKAVLRVYANSNLSSGYLVHTVANNSWSEGSITFENAPAIGGTLASTGAITAFTWVSTDVTAFVTGNGTFSFAITDPSATALNMASRESANAPRLIVVTK